MADYDIIEVQKKQLEMLKDILVVCKKNNIDIYLAWGTALGAVRHKGFIPWDDDIDLFVRYEDRRRLINAVENDMPSNYSYQSFENETEYRWITDKIRDSNSTLIIEDDKNIKINHGFFIDIYPLYYVSDKPLLYLRQLILSYLARLFLWNAPPKHKGMFVTSVATFVLHHFPKELKKKILNNPMGKIQKIGKEGNKECMSPFIGRGLRPHIFKATWFEKKVMVKFENIYAPVAGGTKKILRDLYGDWKKLPPEEERCIHHGYVVVDLNKGYKEYEDV